MRVYEPFVISVDIAAEQVKASVLLHCLQVITFISLLGSRHHKRVCGKNGYDCVRIVLKAGCL